MRPPVGAAARVGLILLVQAGLVQARGYYLDASRAGLPGDGRTPATAWAVFDSVRILRSAAATPGDTLYLARGGVWNGLSIDVWNGGNAGAPFVITHHGSGDLPLPRITSPGKLVSVHGSHVVVAGVALSGANGNCLDVSRGATDVEIRDMELSDCGGGVGVAGQDVRVVANSIHDIRFSATHVGAIGIVLDGARDCRVLDNRLERCGDSWEGKSDGGAIEVFRSVSGCEIARNIARHTIGFIELGGLSGDTVRNLSIHHNLAVETGDFAWFNLDTPADTSDFWGVGYKDIRVDNNTLVDNFRRSTAFGLSTRPVDSTSIRLRNNLFTGDSLAGLLYQDGFDRGYNLYGSPLRLLAKDHRLGPGEFDADPLLELDDRLGYTLAASSPARDAGLDLGYATDLWGHPALQGSAPDIGAIESSTVGVRIRKGAEAWRARRVAGRIFLDRGAGSSEAAIVQASTVSGRSQGAWHVPAGEASLELTGLGGQPGTLVVLTMVASGGGRWSLLLPP